MAHRRTLFLVTSLLTATVAYSCEPILPLAQVVGGPGYLLFSFWALLGAVFLKAAIFSQLQHGLPKIQAAWYMLIANALTTLIGLAVMMVFAIPTFLPVTLVGVWAVSRVPAGRFVKVTKNRFIQRLGSIGVSLALVGLLLVSIATFAAGQGAAAAERLTLYWLLKLLYVYCALTVSLLLTTFWEAWLISKLAARTGKDSVFAVPVFRANAIVLGSAAVVAAVLMLPQRFHSADWLVELVSVVFPRAA